MYISDSVKYIGVNDRDLDLFEGQYIIPEGIAYNSYVILDEKVAVMDTVDERKTEEYLTGLSDSFSEDAPTYLFMCDINSFKQINDSYGHAEGDEALIMVSNAIKAVISVHKGFAARYGGDEFIWVWRCTDAGKTAPDTLICEIEERLKEICGEAKKPYALSFSAGYVCCTDPQRSVYAYIKEADERMYERKKEFHRT